MKLSLALALVVGTSTCTYYVRATNHTFHLPEGITYNSSYVVLPPEENAGQLTPMGEQILFGVSATFPFPGDDCAFGCRVDTECQGNLACFQRLGYDDIPGCTPFNESNPFLNESDPNAFLGVSGGNYCWDIQNEGGSDWNTSVVVGRGLELDSNEANRPPDENNLAACQGYCKDDTKCAAGLACFTLTSSSGPIPGCVGGYIGFNYCYEPPVDSGRIVFVTDDPSSGQLGQCQADCDTDDDCADDLYCFTRSTLEPVPGCPFECPGVNCLGNGVCTAVIDNFAYDIDNTDINATFSDERSSEEIIFTYLVHQRNYTVQLYDRENCNVTIGDGSLVLNTSELLPIGPKKEVYASIDIDQSVPAPSEAFRYTGQFNDTGIYEFCIRIDLLSPEGQSVNFLEIKTNITVDMKEGFEVLSIDTDRDDATTTEKNATLDYTVLAYQCSDTSGSENLDTLTQGSIGTICVETNATDVYVADILALNFTQDDFTYQAIVGGDTQGLTSLDCTQNEICITSTQMISEFFTEASPSPITASGTCVLAFGSSRRLAATGNGKGLRALQADDIDEPFDLTIELKGMSSVGEESTNGDEAAYDSAASFFTTTAIASIVVMIMSAMMM